MPLAASPPGSAAPLEVDGVVERIVFHNPENGFTILRLTPTRPKGGANVSQPWQGEDSIACKGRMLLPKAGARMRLLGKFVNDPRWGRQFNFDSAEELLPSTREDIQLYLASGLIRGIGPQLAARIANRFGDDALRVLDEEPDRLREVHGIGGKKFEQIIQSWEENRGMRALMLFLRPHGVGVAGVARIYRAYGASALEIVRGNPYRLAMDIRGIGFITADAIASSLGFPADHPLRAQAAALYILLRAVDDGHVFLPEKTLIELVCKQLDINPEQAQAALLELERGERVVREELSGGAEPLIGVYLSRFHHCEARAAHYLRRILNSPKSARLPQGDKLLEIALAGMAITLAPAQEKAVLASATAKVLVITGGPGTGKTTIIKAILRIFQAARARILLAAPTGRAAKRMSETCGLEAKTIHRLLEYSPKEDGFARNEDNPLACGLLVVDEASMMDALLFYHLLKALPLGATLVLVGDAQQLPSVGPGNVLGDLIESGAAPVVELNEIFRQSAESEIICNAHLINHGKMPVVEGNTGKLSDFYFIHRNDPEEAAGLIVDLIKNHIPRRFGLDPINEVQLLTPMRKGSVGAENMNSLLQAALNPNALEVRRGDRAFRLHDKVMQVRNNYDKDIFNGDMGRIVYLNPAKKTLSVDFDGVVTPYDFDELDELVPAYAISIHKSQGSEYPAVVIPVMMQHFVLLQRNLIYTGVTRGKKLVVLVGENRALQIAIGNNKTSRRHTWLAQRLRAGIAPGV